MTKQENGTWKISEDEMIDIMICFYQGINHLKKLGCNALANKYFDMYSKYLKEDEKRCY